MKALFDQVTEDYSELVTRRYSTSFSSAVRMLHTSIRQDIYNIYGFVRMADEIVDSFHEYDRERLFNRFEKDLDRALTEKISLNPALNSFQHTVHKYNIDLELVEDFMKSMRMDLFKIDYETQTDYENYIHGSANVVGLMCLKVFLKGDNDQYEKLKEPAIRLGSAFQKVNFLRDLKHDQGVLNRSYFPSVEDNTITDEIKEKLILEIEKDFDIAYQGIINLPHTAKFGVYTAYCYYKRLLSKLKRTPSRELKEKRIRVGNHIKLGLLAKSYIFSKLKLV